MATSPTHFGFAILDFGLVQEDFSLLRQDFPFMPCLPVILML